MPDFSRAISFASDLIRIPGASGAEGAVAERVVRELHELGFDEVCVDEVGNVVGKVRGTGPGPVVALCAHMDVVDAGDERTWEHSPYAGVVEGGFLHGRGAMDIKGPLALMTYAAADFVGREFDGAVWVVFTVYEERAGWGISHFLEHEERLPDVFVIGESTHGDVCVGHRGRAELAVELRGTAGHASAPERARNALDALPAVLDALRSFAAEQPTDEVLGASTFVPTGVVTAPASPNVIPDLVRVTVDWRVLPGLDADRALEDVRAHLAANATPPEGIDVVVRYATVEQRAYTGITSERRLFTPAYRLDVDHPVVRAAVAAVAERIGRTPDVRPWTFATDGGQACGLHGIPTIGFAPGEERYAHTNRERLELEEAERCFDAYVPLVEALLAVPDLAADAS